MKRAKPLAELIEASLGKAVARQGFSGADIILSWPEIVGERLAEFSQPIRLDWPRRPVADRPADPAALVVRTESAFAIELQHLAPVILERVNAFYGWRCVGRLVLKQGPVRRPKPPPQAPRPIGPEARARIADALAPIETDTLRGALGRLGTAIVAAADDRPDDRDGTPVPQS